MSSIERAIENLQTSSNLPAQLATALAEPTAPQHAGRRMAPELAYGRHAGPPPPDARYAAVLLLLFRRNGRWHLPLTERPASLARHGGQISLPGGTVEIDESSAQAALRELHEELGIADPVTMLGRLADCYVFASNFVVTPWLAAAEFEPRWIPDEREVARVVEMPLDVLLNPDTVGCMTIHRGPLVFRAPCHHIDGTAVWGATSVILSELADLLTLQP